MENKIFELQCEKEIIEISYRFDKKNKKKQIIKSFSVLNYNDEDLKNAIFHLNSNDRYYKLVPVSPFDGISKKFIFSCLKCDLYEENIECNCLKNINLIDKKLVNEDENDFYFKELNKYEALFLGLKDGEKDDRNKY